MAHFEDFELARSVYRALQDLRSRNTSATVLELDAIAAQAAIPPSSQRRDNRSYVDEARTDAASVNQGRPYSQQSEKPANHSRGNRKPRDRRHYIRRDIAKD